MQPYDGGIGEVKEPLKSAGYWKPYIQYIHCQYIGWDLNKIFPVSKGSLQFYPKRLTPLTTCKSFFFMWACAINFCHKDLQSFEKLYKRLLHQKKTSLTGFNMIYFPFHPCPPCAEVLQIQEQAEELHHVENVAGVSKDHQIKVHWEAICFLCIFVCGLVNTLHNAAVVISYIMPSTADLIM